MKKEEKQNMINSILFDLDNTLYGYDYAHKKGLQDVYKIFNKKVKKISQERFIRLFNLSRTEVKYELSGTASSHSRVLYFQRLIEKTHNTDEPKLIIQLHETYWNIFLKNMKLFKGVIKTLKELKKQNFKIAIVSDLTTKIQLKKMERLKLSKYIDFLVTSEESGRDKPHPIMFLLTLKKLNVLAEQAIFVGDDPKKDIEGANAVGIKTILISKGKKPKIIKEDYKNPNFIIREIPDLLKIIKKLNKN